MSIHFTVFLTFSGNHSTVADGEKEQEETAALVFFVWRTALAISTPAFFRSSSLAYLGFFVLRCVYFIFSRFQEEETSSAPTLFFFFYFVVVVVVCLLYAEVWVSVLVGGEQRNCSLKCFFSFSYEKKKKKFMKNNKKERSCLSLATAVSCNTTRCGERESVF